MERAKRTLVTLVARRDSGLVSVSFFGWRDAWREQQIAQQLAAVKAEREAVEKMFKDQQQALLVKAAQKFVMMFEGGISRAFFVAWKEIVSEAKALTAKQAASADKLRVMMMSLAGSDAVLRRTYILAWRDAARVSKRKSKQLLSLIHI